VILQLSKNLGLLCFQVLIWIIIPNLRGSPMTNTKNVLRFIIIFQYVPRMFLIFPLSRQIIKATGVVTETAWAGAAYNLMLYMLASHVSYSTLSYRVYCIYRKTKCSRLGLFCFFLKRN